MARLGDLITTCNGRLTLTSGSPVTTDDVTAATTLYFTPYKGDNIAVYDTEEWLFYQLTERSISLSGKTADTNYDVFIYDASGTLTLELVAWSSGTARATELVIQNGVYVKSGDTTRRYLGTIRTTSTIGQCEDSLTKRYVWNYYNRISKKGYDSSASGHTYGTASWRAWNNDTTIRIEFVLGLVEGAVSVLLHGVVRENASGGLTTLIGVGYDTSTSPLDNAIKVHNYDNQTMSAGTEFLHYPGIGYHYYQAMEYSSNGYFGSVEIQAKING